MAFCIRCGYKTSLFKSNFLLDGMICDDCIKEMNVPENARASLSQYSYQTFLSMMNYINPEAIDIVPGTRKSKEYRSPSVRPDIKSANDILNDSIIEKPGFKLEKKEKCYCKIKATLSMTRTKTVKTGGGNYAGVSINLGHGMRYHVGGRTPEKTKQKDVTLSSDVEFFLTSKRIVILVKGTTQSEPYDMINGINFKMSSFTVDFSDGPIQFSTDIVSCNKVHVIYDFIQIKLDEDKIIASDEKSRQTEQKSSRDNRKTDDNPVSLLRSYKSLLDDGIITQEEFEIKKKEILKL